MKVRSKLAQIYNWYLSFDGGKNLFPALLNLQATAAEEEQEPPTPPPKRLPDAEEATPSEHRSSRSASAE